MLEKEVRILKGIGRQDSVVIESFISKNADSIIRFVKENGGALEDAEDLIQDAMMVLLKIAMKEEFVLQKSVADYFYGIVKNLWYERFRGKINVQDYIEVDRTKSEYIDNDDDIIDAINKNERYALYEKHLNKMDDDCRQIFELTNTGIDVNVIAQKMNYTTAYFYKKKFLCKKELITKIMNDPRYHELIGDN